MAIELALVKPVVDAIIGLLKSGKGYKLQADARVALQEAIRELLLVDPNETEIEAKIAVAKAAGIISNDLVLAESMLHRVRVSRKAAKKAVKKTSPRTARKAAPKRAARRSTKRKGRR